MKTSVKSMFLLAFLFLIPNFVQAANSCSYSEQAELNEIVSHVNANYEVVEVYAGKSYDVDNPNEDGSMPEQDVYRKNFDIHILNLTEDIYVKVKNNDNEEVKTFYYRDTQDGVITFRTDNVYKLVTYTIEVYSNKYSCAGEKFREFTLVTPLYNIHSNDIACIKNPEFYYCQEFLTSENITSSEFRLKVKELEAQKELEKEQEHQEKDEGFFEKIKEFYKSNAIVVNSIVGVIVVMGVVATVILIKKKRSRVL